MIIAFTGKKRSGKSTACLHLSKKYPHAVRVNFKDAMVKEIVERFPSFLNELCILMERIDYDGMNPWTPERLFRDKPPVFRAFMQHYGTELRRGDDVDYWAKRWTEEASKHELVLVDDVRFLNEAAAVRALGGRVVRVVRDGQESTDTHSSELEMDTIDADTTIVVKEGDLETLYTFIDYQVA